MPSIASFLNIKVPREKLMEIDGVPLTGKLSATNVKANLINDAIGVRMECN